jgi:hypothetical protein
MTGTALNWGSLLEEGEKFYIVAPCSPLASRYDDFHHTVATLKAKSPEEAAAEGHDMIVAESSEDLDPGYMDHMYVLEIDPSKMVALSKFASFSGVEGANECCGQVGGHSGLCPFRVREDRDE